MNRSTQQQAQYLKNEHADSKACGDIDGRSEFDMQHTRTGCKMASEPGMAGPRDEGITGQHEQDNKMNKTTRSGEKRTPQSGTTDSEIKPRRRGRAAYSLNPSLSLSLPALTAQQDKGMLGGSAAPSARRSSPCMFTFRFSSACSCSPTPNPLPSAALKREDDTTMTGDHETKGRQHGGQDGKATGGPRDDRAPTGPGDNETRGQHDHETTGAQQRQDQRGNETMGDERRDDDKMTRQDDRGDNNTKDDNARGQHYLVSTST
ncbi:hypothetical protein PAXINDRAFT_20731 [Paxillus involutus ATCC 200175]|uniref:Uncharacterized protein n=1 Tax=Paxillus involutus ATCC 200175 TaxID=664439 RepID=A0A0C9T3I7_PAXIN|nr:hypothetical protein PAXINDRAFT_20731 [Paxillus involutus ATCC 200175]